MGGVVRRYIYFLIIYTYILLIPTPLVLVSSFLQQHPYFFVHYLHIFCSFYIKCMLKSISALVLVRSREVVSLALALAMYDSIFDVGLIQLTFHTSVFT